MIKKEKKKIRQIIMDGVITSIAKLVLLTIQAAPIIWAITVSGVLFDKGYFFCATLLLIAGLIMWFIAIHINKNRESDPNRETIIISSGLSRKDYIWMKTMNRKELQTAIHNVYKQGIRVGRRITERDKK